MLASPIYSASVDLCALVMLQHHTKEKWGSKTVALSKLSLTRRLLSELDELGPKTVGLKRIELVQAAIEEAEIGIEDRYKLGETAFRLATNWKPNDGFGRLSNILCISIALQDFVAVHSAALGLQRLLPLAKLDCGEEERLHASAFLEMVQHFYAGTSLPLDLTALSQLLRHETWLPFSHLARISCSLVEDARRAVPYVEFYELLSLLFSKRNVQRVDQTEVIRGTAYLIASRDIQVWASLIPDLSFEEGVAGGQDESPDFAYACGCFLRACFDADSPLLVLLHDQNGTTWIARVCDLSVARQGRQAYEQEIRAQGRLLLDTKGAFDDPLEEDFLERAAKARTNSAKWLARHENVVVRLDSFRGNAL